MYSSESEGGLSGLISFSLGALGFRVHASWRRKTRVLRSVGGSFAVEEDVYMNWM